MAGFLFTIPKPAFTQDGDGGQAGAFLRVGVGAKAMALGSAFTAVANDVSAIYWNPAGIGTLRYKEFMASYTVLSLQRTHNYVGFAIPINSAGTIGVSWVNMGIGDIEGRDFTEQITGSFSNSESAYFLSWGMPVREKLMLGFTAKYLSHTLDQNRSTGFGIDFGVLYRVSDFVNLGLTLQDITTNVKWNTLSGLTERFPLVARLGTAVRPFTRIPAMLGFDFVKVENQSLTLHSGVEYQFVENAGVRLGYDDKRLSAGAFVVLPVGNNMVLADYSFGENPIDQTFAHRISVSIRLSQPPYATYEQMARTRQLGRGQLNGYAKLMRPAPTATVIKTLEAYPEYVLINAGANQGVQPDLRFNIYRLDKSGLGEDKVRIGTVKAIRVEERLSAVQVIWLKEGYQIRQGDILIREDEDE